MNTEITVLMSVYNGEKYLKEAIESILNQTYKNFEFLIINDASTDSSREVTLSYNDPRIRLIDNQKNIGLTRSLNKGLKLAKGKYIARMDADDISFKERLQLQLDFIEQNPRIAVVGGAIVQIDENCTQLSTIHYPLQDKQIKETLRNSCCCIAHPTALIRKKAICAIGGYRTCFTLAQDYDLWLRLADKYGLANLPSPVLYLRTHRNQASIQKLKQQIILSIGARAAAKIRRETGNDPFDRVEYITLENLHQLGVNNVTIQKDIIKSSLWWAENMLKHGYNTEAFQLFSQIQETIRSQKRYNTIHFVINYYYCRCAFRLYHQRNFLDGTKLLIQMLQLDLNLIWKKSK